MTSKQQHGEVITVNGQQYDVHTGMPISTSPTAQSSARSAATAPSPHKKGPQKSHTLSRTSVARPQSRGGSVDGVARKKTRAGQLAAHAAHIHTARPAAPSTTRHPAVHKFATTASSTPTVPTKDLAPTVHPHAVHAQSTLAKKALATTAPAKKPKTAAQLKQEAITKAMAQPAPEPAPRQHPLMKRRSKHLFFGAVGAVSIAVIGIATWMYMPNISVQLASAQAGVAASYPEFRPDGYSLVLPVDHSPDEVTMTFKENGGDSRFSLTQSKSSWDSSAVREKVAKDSKGQFLTTQDRGLTIYTYNGNAAWVNKGILYQITGDSRLSSDYILKIASSL